LLGLAGIEELPAREDLVTMLGEVINEPVFAILDDTSQFLIMKMEVLVSELI